ncbi:hypothetical protein N665_0002s0155 [Sinapis alba]|nr:hypothetical protein N665_0002s0155 [Sinapis alba]
MQSPADSEIRRIVTDTAFGSFVRASAQYIHPPPLANPHNLTTSLPEGISHKEIGIINITAQFLAVYGIYFQHGLIPRVIGDPRFEFMTKPEDDNKHSFFRRLFLGFMSVLKPCQKLTENAGAGPPTEDVLKGFFTLLVQLENQEEEYEGIEKVNLHACEFLANMGDLVIPFPHEHLSMMMQPFRSQINELILPPKHSDQDPLCTSLVDEIKVLGRDMIDAECSYWRKSVSYQAFYQQKQLTRDHQAFLHQQPPPDEALVDSTSTSLGKRGRVMDDNVNVVSGTVRQQHTKNQDGPQLDKLCPPPPLSLSFPCKFMNLIPESITHKELGIIKLTAQFVAVYGMHFRDGLKKRVINDPRFGFLNPTDTDRRYRFYSQICHGYLRVLLPSGKLCKSGDASAETCFEGFDNLVKKLEEGMDMVMVDLHTWEYFANMEDQELILPAEYVSMMMNPVVSQSAQVQDPNPKRPKV